MGNISFPLWQSAYIQKEKSYYPLNSFLCCAWQTPFPMIDTQQDTVVANRLKSNLAKEEQD